MANGDCRPHGDGAYTPYEGSFDEDTSILDSTFDVLADPFRRALVRTLVGRADAVSPDVLADELASGARASADPDRIVVRLIHIDLPKLDRYDLIERDSRGAVRPTEHCFALKSALDAFYDEFVPERID